MHVAAEAPDYLKPEDVPQEVRAKEEEIARGQVKGKPANIVDKIVKEIQSFLRSSLSSLSKVCERQYNHNSWPSRKRGKAPRKAK